MNYRLLDNDGYVLSNISGLSMFKGVIDVKNPNLWWPIGMSNKTAYLYTLQVGGLYVFQKITIITIKTAYLYTIQVGGLYVFVNGKVTVRNHAF